MNAEISAPPSVDSEQKSELSAPEKADVISFIESEKSSKTIIDQFSIGEDGMEGQ